MRSKGIRSNIQNKFNEWVDSITDEKVRNLVRNGSIITGGCITSMLLDEPVNDYDIYFKDKETTMAVAEYYATEYRSRLDSRVEVIDCGTLSEDNRNNMLGIIHPGRVYLMMAASGISRYEMDMSEVENKTKYLPNVITCNAITLYDDIQLIIRFYGNVNQIHSNFDFVHATCYWTSWNNELSLPNKALEAILSKQLIYNGSKYPFSSIVRTRKFLNRDWNITAGEYLKMSFQMSALDLTDVNVLADQLVGVDTAYFYELISKVQRDMENNRDITIDNTYIGDIVNELFN